MDFTSPAVLAALLAVAVVGVAGGWFARRLGEDARKRALEANHREFIRAAGAARDRARTETEEVESRFKRFRQEHEQCSATIQTLRGTTTKLENKVAGHDSTLAEARSAIEERDVRMTELEKDRRSVEMRVRQEAQRIEARLREREQEIAKLNATFLKLKAEAEHDRNAHADCAGVTEQLETRVRELEAALADREAALADGKPPWLLPRPNGRKDDLTAIRGLGTVLERSLNEAGIFHYSQLAQIRPADLDWLARRLKVFPGRIKKDDWAGQAKRMARRPS